MLSPTFERERERQTERRDRERAHILLVQMLDTYCEGNNAIHSLIRTNLISLEMLSPTLSLSNY